MKKILLFLSGGTICTMVKDNLRVINKDAFSVLQDCFYKSDSKFASIDNLFKESENFEILSENMDISNWNILIKNLLKEFENIDDYCGIIIAHGTDTLSYSSALFSALLGKTDIPVFLVSSNAPIKSEGSNGADNFKVAVDLIMSGINPDIYVAYKNSDERMYLHFASRLTACRNYSDDFYSTGMIDITDLSAEDINSIIPKSNNDKYKMLINEFNDKNLLPCVLKINPYVGLNYSAFDYSKYKAVLHTTYHSGTACVGGKNDFSILTMIDKCNEKSIPVFYSPAKSGGETYDSADTIKKYDNVRFLYGMTDEMVYAKLLISFSLGFTSEEIDDFLSCDVSNEYFK
jgi:L-asparaginase